MKLILNTCRSPHDIAENLGVPFQKARDMVENCADYIPGWGAVAKQKYIISRRDSFGDWPKAHKDRIRHYQKLHDQGRVSICTGRDGDFFILYAMPNQKPADRRPYFFTGGAY